MPSVNNSVSVSGKTVTITYSNETATEVHIAGDMNGWNEEATLMEKAGSTFTYTEELGRGYYAYKFVVTNADGTKSWVNDPNCANLEVQAEGKNGYCLVCVDGYSAGWGKMTNGVIKNHYPKGLRKNVTI